MLTILEGLPDGLLELEAPDLHRRLNGPTLCHLPGRREPALFISVLLHGNEITGWEAVRQLLVRYTKQTLPRKVSLFIGNVAAARAGKRRLEDQPDYNRIWNGGSSPEHVTMQTVLAEMRNRQPFAAVDIHNNTGINPHYACVNRIDHRFFHLATLFSPTVVYFTRPDTVLSMAFAAICPAVTLECGQPGQAHGVRHALEYLDACLHLSEIPDHPVAPHDINLYHTVAVVKVPEHISFDVGKGDGDIIFHNDIERLNFRELPAETQLGLVTPGSRVELDVRDEHDREVADRYFKIQGDELVTMRPIMPSMLTCDVEAIRQDCLCYLMERYPVTDSG